MQNLYEEYRDISQKAADFQYAAALLEWDQEVFMPSKGFTFRGRQLAALHSQVHRMLTSDRYGDLLRRLSETEVLDPVQKANIQRSLEDFEKNRKLPPSFITLLANQSSNALDAWLEARKKNDFAVFLPALQQMIRLKQEQADLYGYVNHPYDALLNDFEKGASVAILDPLFNEVEAGLSEVLDIISKFPQVSDDCLHVNTPKEQQFEFSLKVLKAMGFDFEAGRQDFSEHPFSVSIAPTDTRITTRSDEDDFSFLLWSSIHEGGHALYEQGLPVDEYGLPVGNATSLAIHESQSRFWENCIGRGLPFWQYFFPQLQKQLPHQFGAVSLLEFYKAMNRVEPSLIRTESDEITYHYHVMIRYQLEKQLIEGSIKAAELPELWRDSYRRYLGIAPTDARQGLLQDVHWSHGSFGYFPTYSLGSFYAAQFYDQAGKDIKGMEDQMAMGDFSRVLQWLRMHIHQHGRRFTSEELCKRITGKVISFSAFKDYLISKYATIYSN